MHKPCGVSSYYLDHSHKSYHNSLDLLPHPPKVVDLWGIEGEDTDLLLHQAVLHFPLICLRASLASVSLETLVLDCNIDN